MAWKVRTSGRGRPVPQMSCSLREKSSFAARLNMRIRIRRGSNPCSSRCRIRQASVVVLPLPATAVMTQWPGSASMMACCSGVSSMGKCGAASGLVGMAQRAVRADLVADALFQGFDVRKAAVALAAPHQLVIHQNLEGAGTGRLQRHFTQLVLKGRQQFLGHPGAAQQPAAERAVADTDSGFGRDGLGGHGLEIIPGVEVAPLYQPAADGAQTPALAAGGCCQYDVVPLLL